MKTLFFIPLIAATFIVSTLSAQTKAQQDNGQYIAVAQTQKTIGRSTVTHYTMTNNSSVSMDFTLYKQMTNGTWLTTHSLNLQPGGTYDDEGSAIGMSGKYVLYSAPHSAIADFPSFRDIAALQGGSASSTVATMAQPTTPATTPTTTPATPGTTPAIPNPAPAPTPSTTPATNSQMSPPPANTPPPPSTPNTAPPGNPRPVL